MKANPTHRMEQIPAGKTIGDLVPAYAKVRKQFRVGAPGNVCAGCSKPFTLYRRARREIRIYFSRAAIPAAFAYRLCGRCFGIHQRGGEEREILLSKIEAFHEGKETQR